MLFANGEIHLFWYAIPLILAFSIVYAATRHENLRVIGRHAVHVVVWISGFMIVVMLLLKLLS
jgi:hypothetical protein